jgi:hypothetical protein
VLAFGADERVQNYTLTRKSVDVMFCGSAAVIFEVGMFGHRFSAVDRSHIFVCPDV